MAADEPSDASISLRKEEKPPPEPIRMPTVGINWGVRSVVGGVMGGLGLFMALRIGALDNPITQDEMSRQQFVYTAKQMGRRSWSSAKAFAVKGFIFSAGECVVDKVLR